MPERINRTIEDVEADSVKREEDATRKKFLDKSNFSREVERRVFESDDELKYLDVVLEICEEEDIDFDRLLKMLNKPIIEKIRLEAQELNYFPRTGKLPI